MLIDMQNTELHQQTPRRKVGLVDLFAMMVFFTPVVASIGTVRDSGGGFLRYGLGLSIGIILGAALLTIHWRLGTAIWRRFASRSETTKNAVGTALLVYQLLWVFVGLVSGITAGSFLVRHTAP